MPSLNKLYPSTYLKASDLPEEGQIFTIKGVELERMPNNGDEKPVIYFTDAEKGLVCNVTNARVIGKLYGDDTDDWDGCKITLYPTEVSFQGDMVEAIRVRSKKPKEAKANGKSKKPAEPITQAELDAIDEEDDNPPF